MPVDRHTNRRTHHKTRLSYEDRVTISKIKC